MKQMTIFQAWRLALLMNAVLVVSCATQSTPVTPTASIPTVTAIPLTPTSAPLPTVSTNQSVDSPASTPQKLNIDELLPPAPGRELVLQYCVQCHSIAPTIIARKTKDEWKSFRQNHTGRVALSKEDLDKLYDYLATNLTPDKPLPQLPKEFLRDWTSD